MSDIDASKVYLYRSGRPVASYALMVTEADLHESVAMALRRRDRLDLCIDNAKRLLAGETIDPQAFND